MSRRNVSARLTHIRDAVAHAQALLKDKTATDLRADPVVRAAFERFMEIVSEASRHVPDDLKARHPTIPWKDIANFGNHLRHAYNRIDHNVLWSTYEHDLEPLAEAVRHLLIDEVRDCE